jgi:ABC-type molybdate transport system substrate-binding protein
VNELDKASEPWGIKVLRYEIKNITPPQDVLNAMEKQMRAEREKRAVILASEGERDAAINQAEGTKQQVIKGEPFDVPIVQPPLDEVIASGHVVAGSQTPLATVPVVLAVLKGQPKPDISTPNAVRKVLLEARAVSFPNPAAGAAAGVSVMGMLEKLGIVDQVKAKVKYGQLDLVASREVEVGMTFQSEINEPGIDVVGVLPRELITPTALVGFVSAHAKSSDGAKALLAFLSSPEAAATYRKLGMQPAR